ncbi:flagellar hook-length control protein [Mycolicibacter arupensis]|uniref:flagellar hook-length control protein n=1 Tax=Mycolicibacter arupensis TaxID=342002 RepID=UPI00165F8D50|nr:flagellar hook-length control protein [Mycolicibacter arupensis]
MTTMTPEDAIKAAASVARDVADGKLAPADLEAAAAAECRALFGTVAGPDDPLWPLQVDIARQVLALDGVPADALAEWLAVARQRAGEPVSPANASPDAVSAASEAHSAASDTVVADATEPMAAGMADAEPEPQPVPEPTPIPPGRRDEYDPLRGWSPGGGLQRL